MSIVEILCALVSSFEGNAKEVVIVLNCGRILIGKEIDCESIKCEFNSHRSPQILDWPSG